VPDVVLTERRQAALRQLLTAEPIPGDPLPPQAVFEALGRLVPCDLLGVNLTDERGTMLALAGYAPTTGGRLGRVARPFGADVGHEHGGPFYTGWMHWNRNPEEAESCEVELGADDLAIGFANGTHHVVQFGFVRESRAFSPEELALFRMLVPTLGRLARERPTPGLPRHLTAGERTVLGHVAAGLANAEIAEHMGVSVSTVRKHLENAYRKLGVSNRVAAVAHLHGTHRQGVDLRARLQTFA
jgi:DNA-binding CsgD family transcriptional regulator